MKGKILLADDDLEILVSLSAVLNSEGYEVITAANLLPGDGGRSKLHGTLQPTSLQPTIANDIC